jgi:hypothetical protein
MPRSRTLAIALVALVAACADDQLPDAVFDNTEDTFTLGALTETPVSVPSAFSVLDDIVVRTDQSASFDFAYVRSGGRSYLVPLDALGLGARSANPGLLASTQAYETIVDPPTEGYVTADSVEVSVGSVLIARSRLCSFLGVPQYAKLEVTAIDGASATLTFRAITNVNCGYRSLAPGLPSD